jgi:ATP:ADP antiporter, AAA family
MQNRIMEFIKVLPQEQELVLLMILQSFLFGAGNNFIQTAAFTLFLEAFPSQSLPYTYIAIAFIVTGVAFVYLKLGERISFFNLLLANVSFLILLALGFQLGLYSSLSKWVAFGLPVFFQIQVNFVNLAFWGLASRFYNVQQGKRLFGLIGSGLWIGIILTGFTMSYFVSWVGVSNLLWFGVLSMLLSLFSLYFILKRYGGGLSSLPKAPPRQRGRNNPSLSGNRYFALIFAMIFIWWIAFFFIDMLFYDRANARFPDANQLAGFLGSFLGYLGIMTWSLNTFFSGPLINKFGQRVALLILPVLLFIGTGVLVFSAQLGSSVAVLFYMMTSIKLLDLGVGFSIDRTALTVLYQPVAHHIRSRLQTVAEGIVQPIAIGVAGLMLIALNNYFNLETLQLYWVLLVLTIVWIVVALSLGREYPRMILKALDRRILRGEDTLIMTPGMIRHLQDGLKNPNAGAVIYSLNLLESMQYPNLVREYSSLLRHPSEQVKIEALKRIEKSRFSEALPEVKQLLPQFSGPTRGQAIHTIASLSPESSMAEISMFLDDSEPAVRRGVLLGMITSGHSTWMQLAKQRLTALVEAGSHVDRLLAAEVLGESSFEGGATLLEALIAAPEQDVQRAAIQASGKVKDPHLWPVVVNTLDDPGLCSTAVHVLREGGTHVSQLVAPMMLDEYVIQDEDKAVTIARVLGQLGNAQALEALSGNLENPSSNIRYQVLKSLQRNRWKASTQQEKEAIEKVIRNEVGELAWSIAAAADLETVEHAGHLRGALSSHGNMALERVFLALQLLHDEQLIKPAQLSLGSGKDETQRAYAVEVLELTLSSTLRNLLIPVLRSAQPQERLAGLSDTFPQESMGVEARLADILSRSGDISGRWLHAVSLYTAGNLGLTGLSNFGEEALRSPVRLMREVGGLMLKRVGKADSGKDVSGLAEVTETGLQEPANYSLYQGKVEAPMLTTVEKVIILKTIHIFESTPDHILVEVADLLEEETVPAGHTLINKGDIGDCMYIIVAGKMKAHDGDKLLNYLEERDFFGEMALLDLEPRVASITAVEDTTLLRLDQEPFFELMESRIEVARGIISVLTRYLRRSLRELREIQAHNPPVEQ